jgi:hypothetical protein
VREGYCIFARRVRPSRSGREIPGFFILWKSDISVIPSAAQLNEVIRHSRSTVKTPSEMLSRMASVGGRGGPISARISLVLDTLLSICS